MANFADTNVTNIKAAITAKQALLQNIITAINNLTANPKPDYNVDGQQVSWSNYFRTLVDAQDRELDSLEKLYKQLQRWEPFQFQSQGY